MANMLFSLDDYLLLGGLTGQRCYNIVQLLLCLVWVLQYLGCFIFSCFVLLVQGGRKKGGFELDYIFLTILSYIVFSCQQLI